MLTVKDVPYWAAAGFVTAVLIQAAPFFWAPPLWFMALSMPSSTRKSAREARSEPAEQPDRAPARIANDNRLRRTGTRNHAA